MAAPGMFVQPPASGAVRGPVEQRGVEGASVTFPGITLKLPTVHFPAWFHSRSNARMEIDAASAPYVESYAAAPYAVSMAPQSYPTQAGPQPPMHPSRPMRRSRHLPRRQGRRAATHPTRRMLHHSAMRPPRKQAALEQKLRMIEAAEQRLQQRIAELQQYAGQRGARAARYGFATAVDANDSAAGLRRPPCQLFVGTRSTAQHRLDHPTANYARRVGSSASGSALIHR